MCVSGIFVFSGEFFVDDVEVVWFGMRIWSFFFFAGGRLRFNYIWFRLILKFICVFFDSCCGGLGS